MIVGKLGRLPRPIDAKFLRLENYQCATLPKAPDTWLAAPVRLGFYGMYGNDRYGDCVVASFANLLRQQAQLEGRSIQFADAEIIELYLSITGGADTGLVALDFLNCIRLNGFLGHKIEGFAAVDHRNLSRSMSIAWAMGGLHVGTWLPIGVEELPVWDVEPGAQPIPGRGHMVTLAGCQPSGPCFSSWGRLQPATWDFWNTCVDEVYASLDSERRDEPMSDIFLWDDLVRDLACL